MLVKGAKGHFQDYHECAGPRFKLETMPPDRNAHIKIKRSSFYSRY